MRRALPRRGAVRVSSMFGALERLLKGDPSDRTRQAYASQVAAVNSFAPAMGRLTDDELRAKTDEFKARLAAGATLEQLLPEAFAVRRSAGGCTQPARHLTALRRLCARLRTACWACGRSTYSWWAAASFTKDR
jgi:hypothetical protein